MNITIQHNGQNLGPYTLDEANSRLREGKLKPDDMAWVEGSTTWIPLSQVQSIGVKTKQFRPKVMMAILGVFLLLVWIILSSASSNLQGIRDRDESLQHMKDLDYAAKYDRDEYNRLRQADEIARALKR